jgi:hypothetical protein
MNISENIVDCSVAARKKPQSFDETGKKDNLHLLRLYSLNWHSCHWDKALVRRRMAATWIPPFNPGMAKNTDLFMVCGYAHGRYLMARMTPAPDFEDDDDGCHVRSCRCSRRR